MQDGISLLDALLQRSGAGPKALRRLEPPCLTRPRTGGRDLRADCGERRLKQRAAELTGYDAARRVTSASRPEQAAALTPILV
jgi:hypothetical protein